MDVYAGHAGEGVVTPLEELDKLFYGALGEMYLSWDWTCSPSDDKDQGIFMARKFFYKDKRDVCFFMSGREDYDFFSGEMETSR